jgi:hypothetical protein
MTLSDGKSKYLCRELARSSSRALKMLPYQEVKSNLYAMYSRLDDVGELEESFKE